MIDDDIHVCAVLRNFVSDVEYMSFPNADYMPYDDFWIQKLLKDDWKTLRKELKYYSPLYDDNYLLCKWYYVGRGKSVSILQHNFIAFFFPLFRLLKLFKKGNLIIPSIFAKYKDRLREMAFHGDSNGIHGIGVVDNPYVMNVADVEAFKIFRKETGEYLTNIDFHEMHYKKKPSFLHDLDMRCNFAVHILLKGSIENNSPYILIERLIDCTIALESLYLTKNNRRKGEKLALRVNSILNDCDCDIQYFYDMRNDIVHASFIDDTQYDYLKDNLYRYENVLRKSILAFYDINKKFPTKEESLRALDEAQSSPDLKREIQGILKVLNLAR